MRALFVEALNPKLRKCLAPGRHFDSITSYFSLVYHDFPLNISLFTLITRHFNVISCLFVDLRHATTMFDLITPYFDLITPYFDLETRYFDLITRNF